MNATKLLTDILTDLSENVNLSSSALLNETGLGISLDEIETLAANFTADFGDMFGLGEVGGNGSIGNMSTAAQTTTKKPIPNIQSKFTFLKAALIELI